MRTEHESRIFVGLTHAPACGKWFDLVSIEDHDAAISEIGTHGREAEITDSEGALPFHSMSREQIDDALVWLSTDGRYASAALIRAAYYYDSSRYQEICENAGGPWKSGEEWAEDLAESCGYITELSGNVLANYIDFERFARDLVMGGDYFELETSEGSYFVPSGI